MPFLPSQRNVRQAIPALLFPSVLLLLLTVAAPRAATYYVATNGSDSNAGTVSKPWRTLQKAANTLTAGDVVLVANGVYSGFYTSRDGTSSARITCRANGDNVVVNSRNSQTDDNINIEGGNYVTVEGFIVEDAPRVGIRAVQATGVIIRENVVRRSGHTGILTGYTPRVQVIDNVASESGAQHGIYISNSTSSSDNPIVRGNESFGNNQNGIQLNGDCWVGGDGVISGAVIENNVVHHNNWKGFSLISVQTSLIRNNVIYGNGILAGAGGIHLADQPDCGKPSSNNVVVNNTIHEPLIAGIRMTNGSTGNKIFNNLIVASSLSKCIVDEAGGNIIDAVTNMKLTSTVGLFQSPASGDYRLAPASPALERAVFTFSGVTAPYTDLAAVPRPQGLLSDVGAYEQSLSTGVGETPALPVNLEQNAPNPFSGATQIAYAVESEPGVRADLDVFDVRGRLVRKLLRNRVSSGRVIVAWDGRDESGRTVPSGVYFYRLSAGQTTITRRMTLLK